MSFHSTGVAKRLNPAQVRDNWPNSWKAAISDRRNCSADGVSVPFAEHFSRKFHEVQATSRAGATEPVGTSPAWQQRDECRPWFRAKSGG
jgi:hypothetical protein